MEIEFLKQLLTERTKTYLSNEVDYRTFLALCLSGKPGEDVLSRQSTAKKNKDILEVQIRQIRALINDIENKKFDV